MEGIDKPDVTLIDGQVTTSLLGPVSAGPQSFSDRNPTRDNHDGYYNNDTLYDGRQPLKLSYVHISTPIIEFGTFTWLPATPNDPRILPGPEANFTIDRRTGVMLFHYDGAALNANCSPQKKAKLF